MSDQSCQGREHDERGAASVEYGLVASAIAAVIALVVFALGGVTQGMFTNTCIAVDGQTQTGADCTP